MGVQTESLQTLGNSLHTLMDRLTVIGTCTSHSFFGKCANRLIVFMYGSTITKILDELQNYCFKNNNYFGLNLFIHSKL